MAWRKGIVGLFVLGVITVAYLPSASAGGVIIYHSGQDFFEQGPVPAPFDQEAELKGAKAGYVCDIFGFFWAYVTIKNCQPAALKLNDLYQSPELAAAIKAKYPEGSMKIGFWTKHGRWVLGGGLALILLGGVMAHFRGGKDEEEEEGQAA